MSSLQTNQCSVGGEELASLRCIMPVQISVLRAPWRMQLSVYSQDWPSDRVLDRWCRCWVWLFCLFMYITHNPNLEIQFSLLILFIRWSPSFVWLPFNASLHLILTLSKGYKPLRETSRLLIKLLWPIIFTVLDTLGISYRLSGSPTLHNSHFEIIYLLGSVVCCGPDNTPASEIFLTNLPRYSLGVSYISHL